MKIKFKKFSQRARTSTQGTSGSAGFVVYSAEVLKKILEKFFSWVIQFTGAGGWVIDSDYRGNVVVIFFNFSNNYYQIRQRDKTAQKVFQKIVNHTKLEEVSNSDDKTSRGEKGFGSTDLKCRNEL